MCSLDTIIFNAAIASMVIRILATVIAKFIIVALAMNDESSFKVGESSLYRLVYFWIMLFYACSVCLYFREMMVVIFNS